MKKLAIACALAFVGCNSNNGNNGQDGGNMPQPDLAGALPVAVAGHTQDMNGTGGIAGATIEVVGASPANTTTTAADGSYTLMITAGSTVFLRLTAANYKNDERGLVVPAAGGTLDFKPVPVAGYNMVKTQLNLNPDPAKGFVILRFNTTDTSGAYGATLSAGHDPTFSINNSGTPVFSSTAMGTNAQLIFPNVVAGTTTITPNPPSGKSCTLEQMITSWRVDADTFTEVQINCQ